MSPFPCVSALRASIHVIRPSPEARPDCRASMIIPEIEGSGTEGHGEPWHCPAICRITTVASGRDHHRTSLIPPRVSAGSLKSTSEVAFAVLPLLGMRDPELRHPKSSFNRNPESGISNREVFVDSGREGHVRVDLRKIPAPPPLRGSGSRFPASRILLHPESGIGNLES